MDKTSSRIASDTLPECQCSECYECRLRIQLECEEFGIAAISRAIQNLADAIVAYPPGWQWGDGQGGWIALRLAQCLENHGWSVSWRPAGVRSHVERIGERDGWHCAYCQTELYGNPTRPRPSVDHVVPRAQGGSNDLENLVLACPSCNSRKGNRTPEQWLGGGQ